MAVVDFIVRRPDGEVVLLAEAKNKRRTTPAWASQVRRNLMSHLSLRAPYFLLATPDRLYFWFDGGTSEEAPPSAEMDAREVLLPYIRTAGIRDEHFSGPTFELIVSTWLRELVGKRPTGAAARYPAPLYASGFFDALSGSSMTYQPNL